MNTRKRHVGNGNSVRLRLIKYLHCLITIIIFFVFWLQFRYPNGNWHVTRAFRYDIFVFLGYGVLLVWFNKTFNSYTLGYFRIRALAFSQFLSDFFSVTIIYLAVSVAWFKIHSPWPFIPMLVIQAIWNMVWSYAGTYFYYRVASRYHTVVIYRSRRDLARFGDISGKPIERLFNVERYIQYDGTDFFEIKDELSEYDALFAAGVNPTLMNALCKYCAEVQIIK